MQAIKKYIIPMLLVLVAFFVGTWWGSGESQPQSPSAHNHMEQTAETYTCSMHPQVRQNEPGICPLCGMALIVAETSGSAGNLEVVSLSPEAVALSNIQTSPVGISSGGGALALEGEVREDQSGIHRISADFEGRIDRLFAKAEGDLVRKGQKLAILFSPAIVKAQSELMVAAADKSIRPTVYQAARKKLSLWNLSPEQIDLMESNGSNDGKVTVFAKTQGTVKQILASEGQYVKSGASIMEIVDLARVYVSFFVPESLSSQIKPGQKITYQVIGQEEELMGKVTYVAPTLDPGNRTVEVRVSQTKKLKPGTYLRGQLEMGKQHREHLTIPQSAVLWTGDLSIVYVDKGKGAFEYREIQVGKDLGAYVEVVSGINLGESVVSNAAFKVDAAAQLAGKHSMMNTKSGAEADRVEISDDFSKRLRGVLTTYFELKNMLVSDQEGTAQWKALSKALSAIGPEVSGESSWPRLRARMIKDVGAGLAVKGLESQRKVFEELSTSLILVMETYAMDNETPFYKQHCPMAFENKGAFWLSEIERVDNPYFGSQMLHCGTVEHTFGG